MGKAERVPRQRSGNYRMSGFPAFQRIEQVKALELDPPSGEGAQTGGPAEDAGGSVIFRMRPVSLPMEPLTCPRSWADDSTIHRTFQRWVERGVGCRVVWAVLIGMPGVGRVYHLLLGSRPWQHRRLLHGKGAFWGGASYWTPPTGCTRPFSQGLKQEKHPLATVSGLAGGPLQRGGGRSGQPMLHQYETPQADAGEHSGGPAGRRPEPVLGQGVDNPTGHVEPSPTAGYPSAHPAYWRREIGPILRAG